jgi:NTE family protein
MTIDVSAVISGFFPAGSAADVLADRYDEALFGNARIADLNEGAQEVAGRPRRPVFVFNATSLQTGELWQFRSRAMGGPAVGWTEPRETRLAQAVAASSAFPPFLSPLYLRPASADAAQWHDCRQVEHGHANDARFHTRRSIPGEDLARYREEVFLTDGGVRDNLGMVAIEQINRRRIRSEKRALDQLISDSGRAFGFHADPLTNWLSQGLRVTSITSSEPDALRVDALIDRAISFSEDGDAHCDFYRREKERLRRERGGEPSHRLKTLCFGGDGAYWSVQREAPRHRYYEEPPARWIDRDDVGDLGRIATRLQSMDETTAQRLVNWGYLSAHYGLGFINRLWECRQVRRLGVCALPYPEAGLGDRTDRTTSYCLRPVKCDSPMAAAPRP